MAKLEVKGLHKLNRWLEALPRNTNADVSDAFDDILDNAATRVVLNTPVLTGALRKSVHRGPIRGTLGRGYKSEIEVRKDYALEVHESTKPVGALSLAQPGTPEGGVGRKYVERVMKYRGNLNSWTRAIGRGIINSWRKSL